MGIEYTKDGVTEEPRAIRENDFVEVTKGEHKGRYGVAHNLVEEGKWAIVMTRDNDSENIHVEVKNLKPAQAGRR